MTKDKERKRKRDELILGYLVRNNEIVRDNLFEVVSYSENGCEIRVVVRELNDNKSRRRFIVRIIDLIADVNARSNYE